MKKTDEATIRKVVATIAACITGRDLAAHHTARMTLEGKKANAKNSPSALNGFLSCHGKTINDTVDELFGAEFDAKLAKYSASLRGSDLGNKRSLLGGLRDSYREIQRLRGIPDNFGDAVRYFREAAGLTQIELAKALGKHIGTIKAWEVGRETPTHTGHETLTRMEEITGAPPGCLTARFHHLFSFAGGTVSEYGAKIKLLMKKVYRLPYGRWPKKLRDEFERLLHFKTAARTGNLRRTGTWTRKGNRCATADRVIDVLEAFFGYLILPPSDDPQMNGRGMAVEDISLALLSDPILIECWIEFARARTGCYTQDTIYALTLAGGLIRPGTGFLVQHPEFAQIPYIAEKLGNMPAKNGSDPWEQWCAQGHIELGEMRKIITPKVAKGRDPMRPIRAILDMEEPMDALMLFAERLEAGLVRYPNPTDRAVAYRTLVLVQLLTCAPLRIGMYARLIYRRDNTGNLFQRNDGSWWLGFEPIDFKNMKGAAREQYRVPIPQNVWPYIEEYLAVHRPLLAGADTTDYFFRPHPERGTEGDGPMTPDGLSGSVYHASRKLVPNCPGFGAHAFRHIAATSLILADPVGGPQLAAFALNDTIQTIMKAYGHLTAADKFKWWLKALAEKREGFKERRKNA